MKSKIGIILGFIWVTLALEPKADAVGLGVYGFDRDHTNYVNRHIDDVIDASLNYLESSKMSERGRKAIFENTLLHLLEDWEETGDVYHISALLSRLHQTQLAPSVVHSGLTVLIQTIENGSERVLKYKNKTELKEFFFGPGDLSIMKIVAQIERLAKQNRFNDLELSLYNYRLKIFSHFDGRRRLWSFLKRSNQDSERNEFLGVASDQKIKSEELIVQLCQNLFK